MQKLQTMLIGGTLALAACSTVFGQPPIPRPSGNRSGQRPSRVERDSAPPEFGAGAETATHREIEPLAIEFKQLTCLRLDDRGNLLACDAGSDQIKLISPAGKLVATFEPGFGPKAIALAADGTIYCGGEGHLAMLSAAGKVMKTVDAPADVETPPEQMRRGFMRPVQLSGISATEKYVFVAFGSGWSLGSKSKLFRFDRQLERPKLLVEGLRGCCQRCDLIARDGVLYLAENAAHRVVKVDYEGNELAKWGQRSRTELDGFGSCCNPMNLDFDAAGSLYTAESGLGRVKRYSTDGKFLGLVGYVGVERFTNAGRLAASCSNIAIAVTPDGRRVYVMDFKNNLIRVLQKKG